MSCGIYKIVNDINGHIYIGKSKNIENRWNSHKSSSKETSDRSDKNTPIHAAIRKYGIENFHYEIIELCPENELNEKERYWINYYDSYNRRDYYNLTPGGDGNRNIVGEKNPNAKLTLDQVEKIKKLLKQGKTCKEIYKLYKDFVSESTIQFINEGRSWKDPNEKYPLKPKKFSDEQIIDIRQKFQKGQTLKSLAEKYSSTIRVIHCIVQGKTYKNLHLFLRN